MDLGHCEGRAPSHHTPHPAGTGGPLPAQLAVPPAASPPSVLLYHQEAARSHVPEPW